MSDALLEAARGALVALDAIRRLAEHLGGRYGTELAPVCEKLRAAIRDVDDAVDAPDLGDACSDPGGHVWNRSLGEADEARLSGDFENDNIRCIHCGADGDA